MKRNGKGIRVFRLLLLIIIRIVFIPYYFIKYKIKQINTKSLNGNYKII